MDINDINTGGFSMQPGLVYQIVYKIMMVNEWFMDDCLMLHEWFCCCDAKFTLNVWLNCGNDEPAVINDVCFKVDGS